MHKGMLVAVVIPARDEEKHIEKVIDTIPSFVDRIVVVDDGSKDNTARLVKNADLVKLEGNGVGAAIDAGHQHLLRVMEGEFISVVMAGDGQMNPDDMEGLIEPIINGEAHYVKVKDWTEQEKCLSSEELEHSSFPCLQHWHVDRILGCAMRLHGNN